VAPSSVAGGEGTTIAVTVTASDPDGQPITSLTANLTGLPAGHGALFTTAPDNSSGTLTWTPTYTQAGSYNVSFTASNTLSTTTNTAITVQNVDRAPVVVAPATATINEHSQITLTVSASDPDGQSITDFVADFTNLPAGHTATFTTNAAKTLGTFRWTPTYADGRAAPYN